MEENHLAKTISFYSNDNSIYKVTRQAIAKENYAPFGMIGPYRRNNSRKTYMDIFDLILSVPRSTGLLFNEIKENSDPELGIAVMRQFESYDKSKMGTTYQRLAALQKAGLIRKIIPFELPVEELSQLKTPFIAPEKFSYMINPHLLKPYKYSLAVQIWDLLPS